MFNFWKKSKEDNNKEVSETGELTWTDEASKALDQAAAQAPVPAMMKNKIKTELRKAAEEATRKEGRNQVSPEDLMQGLMAKLPQNMRNKVENAMQKGPEGLKDLEKELKKGKK